MKAVGFYYFKPNPVAKPLPPDTTLFGYFRQTMFKWAGYNKYGLYHDDILYWYPDVAEAVRRLPTELHDQRTFRLVRAIQLDLMRSELPREQWVTFEEDITVGRYLTPYLEEVRKEVKEKDQWIAEH
ncbi:hypothetical protein V9T40_003153 [Parthenolecanium corni]|uniref:Cytochrome b-c1 complex subunit 7 n=1 Tax=Parthenolecanium corni TaxID=536013 RepID=A0AAN9Y9E2_9HEMI